MKHRFAAVSATALLALAACGGSDVSTEEARAIVVNGLIEAGQPPDVAECSADAALEQHSPGELVNASGTTTDEVNASVAAIITECATELAPPPTTVPATTVPDTTAAPTTEPNEMFAPAVCTASGDVLVVVAAARELDDPGPAAYEGWVNEALDRTELAVLTTPAGELRDLHLSLHSAVEEFQEVATASGYDATATAASSQAQAIADEITSLADDVRELVAPGCADLDVDDTTEATALAAQLIALDELTPPTTVAAAPTTVPAADVTVDHLATNILVDVPAAWVGENAGVADTKFGPATRFLVRAPDPAVFSEGRFDGTGVSIHARDATVDYTAMLAVSGPAQACTLARETSYDDGVYAGVRREYTDCAGTPVAIVVGGRAPPRCPGRHGRRDPGGRARRPGDRRRAQLVLRVALPGGALAGRPVDEFGHALTELGRAVGGLLLGQRAVGDPVGEARLGVGDEHVDDDVDVDALLLGDRRQRRAVGQLVGERVDLDAEHRGELLAVEQAVCPAAAVRAAVLEAAERPGVLQRGDDRLELLGRQRGVVDQRLQHLAEALAPTGRGVAARVGGVVVGGIGCGDELRQLGGLRGQRRCGRQADRGAPEQAGRQADQGVAAHPAGARRSSFGLHVEFVGESGGHQGSFRSGRHQRRSPR